jgi:hypothetical protein
MTLCYSELQIGTGRDKPPNPKVYETTDGFPIVMLAPSECRQMQALGFGTFTDEAIANLTIANNPKFLWLCGIIKYEDIFRRAKRTHETKFCLLWEIFISPKPFWRIAGPPEYNDTN